MPGVFGGGGGGGNQEIKNEPWGGSKDYLRDILAQSEWQFYNYQPEFYPYSTVAPMSGYSQDALNYMAGRAMSGSPILQAGQQAIYDVAGGGYFGGGPGRKLFRRTAKGKFADPTMGLLSDMAGGSYLNANPYIDAAFANAAEGIGEQFQDAVGGTNAYFSKMGMTGSDAFAESRNELDETLAENLGQLSQDYYYRNYADERNKQMQATGMLSDVYNQDLSRRLGAAQQEQDWYGRDIGLLMQGAQMAPGMAAADYQDIDRLLQAGGQFDAQRQQEINDAVQRWQYHQTGEGSPYGLLGQYARFAYPAAGFGSVQTQPMPQTNTFGNLLSMGLLGAGLLL